LIAATSSLAAFAVAGHVSVLSSTAFDWNALTPKATDVGSVRSITRSPTATLDELEIHVTTLDPGKSPHPPHRHPNEELVIVRQGTVEVLIDGAWKRIGPGSVAFFASNQLHGLRNVGNEPAVYHVINWRTAATPVDSSTH
jgi:quercetin dioxygenase-like cupin family protein